MRQVSTDLLVIGLGYVGLPLAREASIAGLKVAGFDLNETVVIQLNSGISHVDDVPNADMAEMISRGFYATTLQAEIGAPDTVVICVPTPLSSDGIPDLAAVRGASELAGSILRPGMLVVLESTSYPGTTDEVVRPLLEKISGLSAGADFWLAFSPERIDPGNKRYGLRNTPKVVGGYTCECTDVAARFYSKLCDEVIKARSSRPRWPSYSRTLTAT
jgi:UDP-N-acetyl-D-glucosamine dehydrogenase